MQRTRRQILDILKRKGRATLEELAQQVSLSPVTVRVHLSVLQRDDLVKVDEVRGRVGRPYFVYSLTEEAEDLFPKRYHNLAIRLLSSLKASLPEDAVQRVLDNLSEGWAAERAPRLAEKGLAGRVAEVALIRSEEGAIADWESVEGGYRLNQYNCPNLLVSRVHHHVCDSEQRYLEKMLGVPLARTGCIAVGDRVCSYLIAEPGSQVRRF